MPLSLQERFENTLVAQAMSQIPHHISYSAYSLLYQITSTEYYDRSHHAAHAVVGDI